MKQFLKSPSNKEKCTTLGTQGDSSENLICKDDASDEYFKSTLKMLEQRQKFMDEEYKLKIQSLEKRIKYLINVSSQLTQQNTQLKLQYADIVKDYSALKEKLLFQGNALKIKEKEFKLLQENFDTITNEKDRLLILADKYHERSKIKKKQLKEFELILKHLHLTLNQQQKENEFLRQEKQQNLNLPKQNSEIKTQQSWLHSHKEFENQKNEFTEQNSIDQIVKRFLNDYLFHLNYIENETNKLFKVINKKFVNYDLDVGIQKQIMTNVETLIDKYNHILDSQISLQQNLNIPSFQGEFFTSKRSSFANVNLNGNSANRVSQTSKYIKISEQNMILTQFVEAFVQYVSRVKNLNSEIISSQLFSKDFKFIFKKVVTVIIAIIRMQKGKNHTSFKKLFIVLPIEDTFQQLLEIINTQQQLIEKLQE